MDSFPPALRENSSEIESVPTYRDDSFFGMTQRDSEPLYLIFRVSVNCHYLFAPVSVSMSAHADLRQRSFDNSVPAQLAPWAQTCSASSNQQIPSLSASCFGLKHDKLAQNNDQFPDLYSYRYHQVTGGWRGFDLSFSC